MPQDLTCHGEFFVAEFPDISGPIHDTHLDRANPTGASNRSSGSVSRQPQHGTVTSRSPMVGSTVSSPLSSRSRSQNQSSPIAASHRGQKTSSMYWPAS